MKTVTIPHSRPWITEEDKTSVADVLATGMIAKGDKVKEFEERVAAYLGINNAIAQGSGTAALILALKTLQIGVGDETILPTYVCRSVLESVLSVGATPVLCDVNESGVITERTAAPHISQNTKAIIAVHIFGHACDVRALSRLGVVVIENACQSFGLTIGGKMAGAVGDVGVLSFHATKCLTTGEGGMVVTHDPALAEKARTLVDGHQQPTVGSAAPLSDLQAALGLSQLKRYPNFLDRRRQIRDAYVNAYKGVHENISVWCDYTNNPYLFRLSLKMSQGFDEAQREFSLYGIQARRGVDTLLHREMGLSDGLFPNAITLFRQNVSLPFYPALEEVEIERVCDALSNISRG